MIDCLHGYSFVFVRSHVFVANCGSVIFVVINILIKLEHSTLSNVRVIGKVVLSKSTVSILLTCFIVEKPSYGILCSADGLTSQLVLTFN